MPLLIGLFVLALLLVPLWVIVRIVSLGRETEDLKRKLVDVELELDRVRREALSRRTIEVTRPGTAAPRAESAPVASPSAAALPVQPAPVPPQVAEPAQTLAVPPPVAVAGLPEPTVAESSPPPIAPAQLPPIAEPPPLKPPAVPAWVVSPAPVAPEPEPAPAASYFEWINWEQFMGAKLFAWLGGLAAFLGAAYFIRYSFEHNWIPDEARAAIGFLFALGLIVGGLKVPRERYAVTAQTLIATGIVSLYAVTFACNAYYHFAFFGPVATFLLMALITTAAFLLAVRLDARVIAILGILGGFLTPALLSTGHDNPGGLFGYLALLDVGLIAVALHRRWHFLVPLGAAGTAIMQVAWAGKFFTDEKAGIAMIVCLGFAALFLGACVVARRRGGSSRELLWSAVALACICFGFALYFNTHTGLRARPGLVFGFALLADACLFALAWVERKGVLVAIAAAGAILVEVMWAAFNITAENAPTAMAVCLVFCAVFLGAYFVARAFPPADDRTDRPRVAPEIVYSAVAMPVVAFVLAFVFIGSPPIAARPGLLLSFVLLADACLLAMAWFDEQLPKLHLIAGIATFALLAIWTHLALTNDLVSWALAFYLAYAALHTAFPLVLERHRPSAAPTAWSQIFPPLALLMMLGPVLKLDSLSLLFWPCVLLVDLIAIAVAFVTASLLAVALVFVLTLGVTGAWLFRMPVTSGSAIELLVVLGGFAVLFFVANVLLGCRLSRGAAAIAGGANAVFGDARTQLPAFSALLPFLLLILATQRLPLANPSPLFGLALLLVVLTLGLAVVMTLEWLPACALAGVGGLEYAWHATSFDVSQPVAPLTWYLAFAIIFAAFPFVFRKRFAASIGPWVVAALSGVVQFPLVYWIVKQAWANGYLGLLPAAFAIPPLLSLVAVLRLPAANDRVRLNQLAWFGGVALLFITLIFPIQFDRQWITIGWALEGAALLWLFHRVPHPGLRLVGVALLIVAFARLSLNPAVLEYHARSGVALLNWYLYSYGLVTAALFVGARLMAPPRDIVLGSSGPRVLNTLGTILAFLLLNIEIADFFSAPGTTVLTFQFSGNFARDMTYTIAWSLFALGLLLVSIWQRQRAGRYAALALLSVSLLKLFFHDLAHLDSLYRIGALFGVAVVATVASFAYQRFLPSNDSIPRDK